MKDLTSWKLPFVLLHIPHKEDGLNPREKKEEKKKKKKKEGGGGRESDGQGKHTNLDKTSSPT